jgi:integrase
LPEQITNQPVGLHAALLEALEAKRSLRRATFKSYYMVMTKLEAFCGQRFGGWPLVGDFSTADARAYQQWLHKGGLGNTSVNTYCTCTAGLFAEVVRAGHIEANPFFRLPKLRIDPKLHRPFTPEQMQLIHTHLLERHPVLGFFIELMHYSLLRPAEICKLKFEHLDPKTGRLLVPGEVRKNRKPHMALLPSWTVDKWEALARDYPRHYHVFGFRFSPGERPAVRDSFSTRHRAIMDELGFGAHYTLYSWRHSGAAALVEAGVDIFDLQRQMGHSNPTTTQVYLRALGFVPSKDLRAKFVQLGTGPGP